MVQAEHIGDGIRCLLQKFTLKRLTNYWTL